MNLYLPLGKFTSPELSLPNHLSSIPFYKFQVQHVLFIQASVPQTAKIQLITTAPTTLIMHPTTLLSFPLLLLLSLLFLSPVVHATDGAILMCSKPKYTVPCKSFNLNPNKCYVMPDVIAKQGKGSSFKITMGKYECAMWAGKKCDATGGEHTGYVDHVEKMADEGRKWRSFVCRRHA